MGYGRRRKIRISRRTARVIAVAAAAAVALTAAVRLTVFLLTDPQDRYHFVTVAGGAEDTVRGGQSYEPLDPSDAEALAAEFGASPMPAFVPEDMRLRSLSRVVMAKASAGLDYAAKYAPTALAEYSAGGRKSRGMWVMTCDRKAPGVMAKSRYSVCNLTVLDSESTVFATFGGKDVTVFKCTSGGANFVKFTARGQIWIAYFKGFSKREIRLTVTSLVTGEAPERQSGGRA